MTELQQYIHTYFEVAKDQLATIDQLFEQHTLAKEGYYCRAGRTCETLSFVHSGFLRMYAVVDDREVTQWIAGKGYFVTDLASFLFKVPGRWNIQALTEVSLFTISRDAYEHIGEKLPEWDKLEKLFIAKCAITMESRIFSHLSLSAEERYDRLFEEQRELLNIVPLQYLASMLGMTPETFSRIRKKKLS